MKILTTDGATFTITPTAGYVRLVVEKGDAKVTTLVAAHEAGAVVEGLRGAAVEARP